MDRRLVHLIVALLLSAPIGPCAVGQSPDADRTLQVDLRSTVWFPRLRGSSRLGPAASTLRLDLDTELSLRDTQLTFRGDVEVIKSQRYHLHFSAFDFDVTGSGTSAGFADFGTVDLNPGDPYRSSVQITSYAAEFGVRVWTEEGGDADLWLMPYAALRFVDVDQVVEEIGGNRERAGGQWLGTLLGFRFRVDWHDPPDGFGRRIELDCSSAVGPALGHDGGSVWQLNAGATVFVTDKVGIRFGFNLLELDLDDADYNFGGGLQGLYLAATIRF